MKVKGKYPETERWGEIKRLVYVRESSVIWIDKGHIALSLQISLSVSEQLVEILWSNVEMRTVAVGKLFPFTV